MICIDHPLHPVLFHRSSIHFERCKENPRGGSFWQLSTFPRPNVKRCLLDRLLVNAVNLNMYTEKHFVLNILICFFWGEEQIDGATPSAHLLVWCHCCLGWFSTLISWVSIHFSSCHAPPFFFFWKIQVSLRIEFCSIENLSFWHISDVVIGH